MSGPDGVEERTACADELNESVLDQIEIDEAEADNYSEDPEQFEREFDRDAMRTW